jgi:cobalt-precorrin-5B (C1)-methyltransferase
MMLLGLPELAYVEMGEFTGHALARCRAGGVQAVTIAGMIGKLSKIAQGHLMTHVAANQVDMGFLADIARERGADPATVDEIAAGNTARHFQEIVIREGTTGVFAHICELVSERCDVVLGGDIDVECILFDFNGEVLGRAAKGSLLD